MVTIENNTITITQGDTLETAVLISTSDGDEFTPSAGDVIRFALKGGYRDAEPLIVKQIPNDTLVLRLESEETKQLPARRRPYVYDVQLTTPDGTVDTFISGTLIVTEEVD